ncbi:MAG: hypothetical protein RIT25_1000 [Planctomycetota bacterium]
MPVVSILLFATGFFLLVLGAGWLIRGAVAIAGAAGVSPLVIGLTVVAMGTSSPELAVSLQSAWLGQADMAVGNVVGSNICNVLLILGLSAAVTPLLVAQELVRRDVPLLILLSLAVWALGVQGGLHWFHGLVLLAALLVHTIWCIHASRRESRQVQSEYRAGFGGDPGGWVRTSILLLGGFGTLVLGSHFLVEGAVAVARWLAVPETVIALTIVAIGTSMPEVAASVLAAARGQRDIAVGNVVGSCLFNLMGVLGASSLFAGELPVAAGIATFDLPVMVACAIACLPIFARDRTIARWQGFVFLGFYAAYLVFLVLDATGHEARHGYAAVMGEFVLPLTGLTAVVLVVRAHVRRRDR